MKNTLINKKKIFNDPIYGFINIPYEIIFDLIEHPYFQRLRRIKQLGLTHLVYPGALHTRFHHAIGAMHLMTEAIEIIRSKGHVITEEEAQAVTIAILLHDIGHGPFSHSLENIIIHNINHEDISLLFMKKLNKEFNHKLDLAIKIFTNKYKKKFLHQLVSSQLDVDRLDYLRRDSFYTGVSEGVISYERILKMLNVKNDELVIEHKGIYSIEKFIIARRLMYWQVYLHKTVLSAEILILKILKRAKELAEKDIKLFCTPSFEYFLYNKIDKSLFIEPDKYDNVLDKFSELDDYDIYSAIKVWTKSDDKILSILCKQLVERKLFKIELQNQPFKSEYIANIKDNIYQHYKDNLFVNYFFTTNFIENNAYDDEHDIIKIMMKTGDLTDIINASDQLNISMLTKPVRKYFVSYPKYFIE